MISFDEAQQIVFSNLRNFGTEEIPLRQGIGRVLQEEWFADRAMPPYNRVTMDGIAIKFNSSNTEHKAHPIEGVAAAGKAQMALKNPANCLEVMTGSMLPIGTDTVIRYEDLTIASGEAIINVPIKLGQNIHTKGEDRKAGELLLSAGTKLSASEIAIGASIGKSPIKVARLPKTLIISTGDELVQIHEKPLDHQIRKSNVYQLEATLAQAGLKANTAHLKDNFDDIIREMTHYINRYETIILSGGVSMGKFDYLPKALEELGVSKLFHKVKQRPGKPFWFGKHANGCTVFALPGNPISSFMCTQVYLLDWINRCMGLVAKAQPTAILTSQVTFKKPLTYFLEVKIIHNEKGQLFAIPQRGHGSGDLANLIKGDAFIKLPADRDLFAEGEAFPIYYYR